MNYTKLASEARKLYTALRDEEFDAESACEIVKVCVQDYPIFREMIEKEETSEEAIGYLYFTNGSKEPIYKYLHVCGDTYEMHTKDNVYRQVIYTERDMFSLSGYKTVSEYYTYIDKDWKRIYTVDHNELF